MRSAFKFQLTSTWCNLASLGLTQAFLKKILHKLLGKKIREEKRRAKKFEKRSLWFVFNLIILRPKKLFYVILLHGLKD